ncbi:hypothetical protein [Granulosicoccus antarcticus]|uniref:Ubiquinol-cytochrome c reductase iron-sulfur subunit n=1 Tax=Granulosicoccus antarcticus IMCC3135 TaxID=1192854 RepID=A0A2Z2NNV5_9GAMM|nr:hypothetical protein [Granulosicoccus antarcticus]ASJ72215.1 Ubiquinol-cytochrome c reductase iron-sulfur subunit [Granulosicoccus antarcticus IMCC3135]
MSVKPTSVEDQQRRLKLRVAVKLMLSLGVLGVLYVFIAGLRSGGGDVDDVPSLRVSTADLLPGQHRLLSWEGRPVMLYRRQDSDYANLRTPDERLSDPQSAKSIQPQTMATPFRSATPDVFVAIALGTDQGCSISFLPPDDSLFQRLPWTGGFVDSCRKSRYDVAGRVYETQYADKNLVVPPYTFNDEVLILGR